MKIQLQNSVTHDGKFYDVGIYEAEDLPENGKLFLSKSFNRGHFGPATARILEDNPAEQPGKVTDAPDVPAVIASKISKKKEALENLQAAGMSIKASKSASLEN